MFILWNFQVEIVSITALNLARMELELDLHLQQVSEHPKKNPKNRNTKFQNPKSNPKNPKFKIQNPIPTTQNSDIQYPKSHPKNTKYQNSKSKIPSQKPKIPKSKIPSQKSKIPKFKLQYPKYPIYQNSKSEIPKRDTQSQLKETHRNGRTTDAGFGFFHDKRRRSPCKGWGCKIG